MGLVKKLTFALLFIAGAVGLVAKVRNKRRMRKQFFYKGIIGLIFNTYKRMSCRMRINARRNWISALIH